jgi:hypothetical protein
VITHDDDDDDDDDEGGLDHNFDVMDQRRRRRRRGKATLMLASVWGVRAFGRHETVIAELSFVRKADPGS